MVITHASKKQEEKEERKKRRKRAVSSTPLPTIDGKEAEGGGGGGGGGDSHAQFWGLFRGTSRWRRRDTNKDQEEEEEEEEPTPLPSSTAPASYPTRQFPFFFLVIEVALLAFCLSLLLRENADLTCLVVPPTYPAVRPSNPPPIHVFSTMCPPNQTHLLNHPPPTHPLQSMNKWIQELYSTLLQRSSRRRGGTQMCYGVWSCQGGGVVDYPFTLTYRQAHTRRMLDIIMVWEWVGGWVGR